MTRKFPLKTRIGFRIEDIGVAILLRITKRMSAAALIRTAGRVGGTIGRHLPVARKRVEKNLTLIHPDMPADARRRIAGEVCAGLLMTGAEYMRMHELAADPSLMEIEGAEHVQAALDAQRPIVFVTAHFGCWDFIRLAARQIGVETAIIYRAFNNPTFDATSQGMIAHAGTPVLHKGRTGTRGLVRHVGRGGAALILVDQRQTGSPLLPFLGHPAETATAAAELAARTRAALIPARVLRVAPGEKYHVRFEAEVPTQDAEAAMTEVNARIGAWVTEHPGHWFWLHRRWRHNAAHAAARRARIEG